MGFNRFKASLVAASLALCAQIANAQTPIPTVAPTVAPTSPAAPSGFLQAEGIVGDVDKFHRSPLLTVSTQTTSTGVKILADVLELDEVYVGYPIQVSFFINRKLFSTQYRSPELPGPLGVDVAKDVVQPPFNYAIVAMLLHPNRTFTTVIQGAVFGTELVKTYDCTFTLQPAGTTDFIDYTANKVASTQRTENSFDLDFPAVDESGLNKVTVKVSITISGDTATATGTSTDKDDHATELNMSGTAVKTNGAIESFDVSSSDLSQSLNCSISQ